MKSKKINKFQQTMKNLFNPKFNPKKKTNKARVTTRTDTDLFLVVDTPPPNTSHSKSENKADSFALIEKPKSVLPTRPKFTVRSLISKRSNRVNQAGAARANLHKKMAELERYRACDFTSNLKIMQEHTLAREVELGPDWRQKILDGEAEEEPEDALEGELTRKIVSTDLEQAFETTQDPNPIQLPSPLGPAPTFNHRLFNQLMTELDSDDDPEVETETKHAH